MVKVFVDCCERRQCLSNASTGAPPTESLRTSYPSTGPRHAGEILTFRSARGYAVYYSWFPAAVCTCGLQDYGCRILWLWWRWLLLDPVVRYRWRYSASVSVWVSYTTRIIEPLLEYPLIKCDRRLILNYTSCLFHRLPSSRRTVGLPDSPTLLTTSLCFAVGKQVKRSFLTTYPSFDNHYYLTYQMNPRHVHTGSS